LPVVKASKIAKWVIVPHDPVAWSNSTAAAELVVTPLEGAAKVMA
jgi:hypothetical protein